MQEGAIRRRNWRVQKSLKIAVGVCLLLGMGFIIGLWLASLNDKTVKPPRHIVERINFSVYLPKKLPGNYYVESNSFTLKEGVLIFKAIDGTGGVITFTEQQKPKDFNFDDFYKQHLKEARTLSDTPYPSTYGLNGKTKMVSIVTEDTWIIGNSSSSLHKDDMQHIAQNIKVYKE